MDDNHLTEKQFQAFCSMLNGEHFTPTHLQKRGGLVRRGEKWQYLTRDCSGHTKCYVTVYICHGTVTVYHTTDPRSGNHHYKFEAADRFEAARKLVAETTAAHRRTIEEN